MTVTFLERRSNQCCAPVSGDPGPEMQVCGEPVVPGLSYCAVHRSQFLIRVTLPVLKQLDREAAKPRVHMRMPAFEEAF